MEEEQNKKRDAREATPQQVRDFLANRGKFKIDYSIIPHLELPRNSWFTNEHLYIQQTNLDDVWRMGYSPIRFIGSRHVEWLSFDAEPGDVKLFSEVILHYSMSDWHPLRIIGQSLTDIHWALTSPFHRIQVISVNEKMANSPPDLIDDQTDVNWRWIVTFKWISKKEEIFSKPPIKDGRYGQWFDDEQYVEYVKNEGLYKTWQMDQVLKMAEDNILQKVKGTSKTPKELRHDEQQKKERKSHDARPRYVRLDEEMRGVYQEDQDDGGGGAKTTIKPTWWPF